MICEECGAREGVRLCDDPDTDEETALCASCEASIFGSFDGPPYTDEEDPDDEFANTCITAADYMREDDGS